MDNMDNFSAIHKNDAVEIAVFSGNDKNSVIREILNCRSLDVYHTTMHDFCNSLSTRVSCADSVRAFVVFRGWEDFLEQTNTENLKYIDFHDDDTPGKQIGKTVYLFPGNGIYQKKMLSLLCSVSGFFESRLGELNIFTKQHSGYDLLDDEVENDVVKQLRVFASELVIAEFWETCGCKADYIIGHSMGEYAAACFSGVMSENDAIMALVSRSQILERCISHRMMAVETSANSLLNLAESIGVSVEISAFNAPELVTVSGEVEMIDRLYQELKLIGVHANLINTNYGGHFSGLKEHADRFIESISQMKLNPPTKRIISTVYPAHAQIAPSNLEYWSDHIYMPVRFEQAIKELPTAEISRVVDVGVTPVLLGMAMRNIGDLDITWIPTVRAGRNYRQQLYRAIGLAFNSGIDINWKMLY